MVAAPHGLQRPFKQVPSPRRSKIGPPLITGEGHKVQLPALLIPHQTPSHTQILLGAPRPSSRGHGRCGCPTSLRLGTWVSREARPSQNPFTKTQSQQQIRVPHVPAVGDVGDAGAPCPCRWGRGRCGCPMSLPLGTWVSREARPNPLPSEPAPNYGPVPGGSGTVIVRSFTLPVTRTGISPKAPIICSPSPLPLAVSSVRALAAARKMKLPSGT
jgi:hypothetical protein